MEHRSSRLPALFRKRAAAVDAGPVKGYSNTQRPARARHAVEIQRVERELAHDTMAHASNECGQDDRTRRAGDRVRGSRVSTNYSACAIVSACR